MNVATTPFLDGIERPQATLNPVPTVRSPALIVSNYSSALDSESLKFTRQEGSDSYYFEEIKVIPKRKGNYTFKSNSALDSFGCLYAVPFDPLNVTSNLLACADDDDETGKDDQFSISYLLEAGRTYILVFTTFEPAVKGSFTITVLGPARVSLIKTPVKSTSSPTTCKYHAYLLIVFLHSEDC
ncbi:unnamed protein product [Rotaria sp. Silwood2]|nr:unnamed protein product [Rotaria sp. Silwood2]CAF4536676.1 unnamed protein product [Rotaria sp. Silwood2]